MAGAVGPAGGSEPFSVGADGVLVLDVYVQPGAARSKVVGRHGSAVKVRVAAPPEKGKANAAVTTLLAAELGVRKRDVAVVGGETSRAKRVKVEGVDVERVRGWLAGTS